MNEMYQDPRSQELKEKLNQMRPQHGPSTSLPQQPEQKNALDGLVVALSTIGRHALQTLILWWGYSTLSAHVAFPKLGFWELASIYFSGRILLEIVASTIRSVVK